MHLERLAVEAGAMANIAGDIDIRHELHLDPQLTLPLAGFTPAAMHVEREPACFVSAHFAFG